MAGDRDGRENYNGLPSVIFYISNVENAVPIKGALEEEEDREEERCFKYKGSSLGGRGSVFGQADK